MLVMFDLLFPKLLATALYVGYVTFDSLFPKLLATAIWYGSLLYYETIYCCC